MGKKNMALKQQDLECAARAELNLQTDGAQKLSSFQVNRHVVSSVHQDIVAITDHPDISEMLDQSHSKDNNDELVASSNGGFKVPRVPIRSIGKPKHTDVNLNNHCKYSKLDKTMVFINASRKAWDAAVSQMAQSGDDQIRTVFKSMSKSIRSFLYMFFKCKRMDYPAVITNEDISTYIVDAMQHRFRDETPTLQQIAIGIFNVLHMGRISFSAIKRKPAHKPKKTT